MDLGLLLAWVYAARLQRGGEIPMLFTSGMLFSVWRNTVSMPQLDLAAIFRAYANDLPVSNHLPATVLENRRRRAHTRLQDALASRGTDTVPPELAREIRQLIRKWAQQSFADGLKEMEEFEIRCAREHDLVVAQASGNTAEILQALATDYRRRVIEQYGCIELRGIQTSERVYFDLDRVFVPLYLAETPSYLDTMSQRAKEEQALEAFVGRMARLPVLDVLRRHRHLLIVGTPGSGKTTLVAYLATQAAQGGLFAGGDGPQDVLPFVLTVRTFTTGTITPENIARLTDCDEKLVQHALETARAMLFVDGIDEAPRNMAPQILRSLVQFRKAHPRTSVVVTGRPSGIREQELPGFTSAELLTMTRDEVDSFIDKWCLAAELSVSNDVQMAERKGQEAANDLKQRLERSRPIQRLVETPLLATILCVVHRFLGHRIPEHRVTLYEKCTDALFYEWDRSKFGHVTLVGELDALAKSQLLSGLACQMHERKQAEVPEAEVLTHFEQVLPNFGYKANDAQQIVEEIRDRSGVLVERRPGSFAFSHLLFQEYLTALTFTPQSYKELANHYDDPWWHEVIVLAAGTQGADAGRLVNELLRKEGPAATFLAAQCLETAVQMPLDVREKIEQQLSKFIPPKTTEDVVQLINLGVVAAPALTKALGETLSQGEALHILFVLMRIDYEPAIGAIARFATDHSYRDAWWEMQAFAMYLLAQNASSSKLAKTTFLASVPKLWSAAAIELARLLQGHIRSLGAESREREILQELLDALPAETKKD
jgi:hypothetical protein